MAFFEPTFVDFDYPSLYGHGGVNLLNHLSTLVDTTSHHILLHLELQAAVVSQQQLVFSLLVLRGHQGRVALL